MVDIGIAIDLLVNRGRQKIRKFSDFSYNLNSINHKTVTLLLIDNFKVL